MSYHALSLVSILKERMPCVKVRSWLKSQSPVIEEHTDCQSGEGGEKLLSEKQRRKKLFVVVQ